MFRLFFIGLDLLVCTVILVPLCRVLNSRMMEKRGQTERILYVIFAVYLISVFSATGLPASNSVTWDPSFHLIPFLGMANSPVSYIEGCILNVILFVPMGILLPLLWKEFRELKCTALFGLSFSLGIELLQVFTLRLTDVDDLITNTLGTVVGYWIAKIIISLFKIKFGQGKGRCRKELLAVIVLSSLVWFLFSPFVGIIYMIMYGVSFI